MSRPVYIFITALIVIFIATPWATIYFCGPSCNAYIDSFNGKIVSILAIDVAAIAILMQLYIYFVPASAIRHTRSVISLCKAGVLAGFILPWGSYFVVKSKIIETEIVVKFDEAGIASGMTLAVCWCALVFLTKEYNKLRMPENIEWAMNE